ncbi:hypothetical protein AB0G32_14050 [Streptomyces sp. NPDC023723]|uniref:hypothetical protein n=1 Tax=Streptomyces sp. NPDC023723 TaxID=3154323 RepID=UPI0033E0F9B3
MSGSTASRTAEVGDLVRATGRGCQAVLTDVRDGIPYLRHRYGAATFAEPWPTTWTAVELISKRGTWEGP